MSQQLQLPPIEYLPYNPLVQALFAVNCTVAGLMVIVVSLRIYARIHFKAGLGWDDAFILMSLPSALGMLIISGFFGRLFIGHPIAEVPIQNSLLVSRLMFAYEILYVCAVGTTKLSILCFYLRVFVTSYVRLGSKIGIAVVCLGELGMILQPFLMCKPWQALWDKTIPGKCGNHHASLIAMGVWAMVSDMAVLSLPVPALWSLHMDRRKKIGLIVVFSIGLIATIIAACRVYVLAAVYETGFPGADSAATATWPDFLAVLEPNLNILCISLPMLASLFKQALGKTTHGSSNPEYYHAGSRSRTFGHSSNANKFQRMDDRGIHMDTMMKTECRADTRSESGSETALSPSTGVKVVTQGMQVPAPAGGKGDILGDGIRVERSLHMSVTEAK